jgi:hypothetical protein
MVSAKQNDSDIPFIIAAFLNEGAKGCRRLREETLARMSAETRRRLKNGEPVTLTQPQRIALALGSVVNLAEEDRAELRGVVDLWLDAEGDWKKFTKAMLKQNGMGAMTPYSSGRFTVDSTTGAIRMQPERGASDAQGLMLQLLFCPDSWRLAGKCRNCGRYMIRKTKREMLYCSKKCDNALNVVAAKFANREEVKKRKADHINAASARYKPGRESWRDFVFREANKAWQRDLDKPKWASISDNNEITQTFLTQRINDGSVKEQTN